MIRKFKGISRSLAAIAVLAAVVGCDAKSAKNPGQSLQSPTQPLAGLSIAIGATRTRLQVGDDQTVSVISIEVLRTADWTPVANGTDAAFTATLGAIDSPSGARTATIKLFSGKGSITLYPGTTEGTARVTVNVLGVVANVNITIDPDPTGGLPPEPAPTQSTLTLQVTPGFVSKSDTSDPILLAVEATVLGTDGDPFKGAGVFFTDDSGLGTFPSGTATSSIFKTNSAGQVTDTLSIANADLQAFLGATFKITAHLGIEGGEKLASFTVSVLAAPPSPAANSITMNATPGNVPNDATTPITLEALVRDQFGAPFPGALVSFSAQTGTLGGGTTTTTDGSGKATKTLTVTPADLSGLTSFTATATVGTATGNKSATSTITVSSTPPPALIANFTYVASLTTDVDFTDTSTGSPNAWRWDFDNDGAVDSTDQNPANVDFTPYGGAGTYMVKLTVLRDSDGTSDTVIKSVTVP